MSYAVFGHVSIKPTLIPRIAALLGALCCGACVHDPTCEDLANCANALDAGAEAGNPDSQTQVIAPLGTLAPPATGESASATGATQGTGTGTNESSTGTNESSTGTNESSSVSTGTNESSSVSTGTDDGTGTDSAIEPDLQGGCTDGCFIEGTCYSDGEVNSENGCLVCDPASSTNDWTNGDGRSCDDGLYCTVNDQCKAGQCVGDERLCDDGVACNGTESCDDTQAQCVGSQSTCDSDQVCDVENDMCASTCAGCVIDGSCYADGDVSSTNSCLICDPALAADKWSVSFGATCDDGDLCTQQDACNSQGQCLGTAVTCQSDSGTCGATRACDPGSGQCVAQYPGNSVSCNDSDACTANDRCDGVGQCKGTPALGAGCACITNSDCNDNVACTQDACNSGSCTHTIQAGSCLIGGTCVANGAPDPSNACRSCNTSSNTTAWSNSSPGTSCDDGLWCNGTDTCNAGSCTHQYSNNNRCAGTTGACEVQTCSESKKTCYKPAGDVCGQQTNTGCAMGNACSADVYTWPVQYTCSGTGPNCGTTGTPRQDLATVLTNCGAAEACQSATATCRPALGCSTTYCKSGLCWTKTNAPMQYAQDPARKYCSDVDLAGRTDWRLPTVAEMKTLVEGPVGGCYWPSEMGDCNDEFWTTDDSQSFAFWVGTTGLQISSVPLYVRCVLTE